MDSGLEHITLPRESQMEIPRISITNLEHHLQTIRTHGQYRPTGNDLMEAQQKLKNWALKHLSFGPLLFGILHLYIIFIIIISIITCSFIYSSQYLHSSFLSALYLTNGQTLRAYLIKLFFNHTNNPTPEIQA
jgi:hypothetical protein